MTVDQGNTGAKPEDASNLVRRCIDGDDEARARFIALYDPLIRRAVTRRILATASARANAAYIDDITHEVYTKIFADGCRALESLRDARRVDSWLVTVSQNFTVSYLRKQGVPAQAVAEGAREIPAPYHLAPDSVAIANEIVERLAQAMAELEDKDRIVLQLFYVYNLRYADIAGMLDMNINTVASRIMRAKRKLRDTLQENPA